MTKQEQLERGMAEFLRVRDEDAVKRYRMTDAEFDALKAAIDRERAEEKKAVIIPRVAKGGSRKTVERLRDRINKWWNQADELRKQGKSDPRPEKHFEELETKCAMLRHLCDEFSTRLEAAEHQIAELQKQLDSKSSRSAEDDPGTSRRTPQERKV